MKFEFVIPKICEKTGITQNETFIVIEKIIESMKNTILQYEKLEIRRFGTFIIKKRKQRYSYNFKTGEKVFVPAHKSIAFIAGTILKKRLKEKFF